MRRFYVLSSGGFGFELAEELAGDVALETASELAGAFAFRGPSLDVCLGLRVLAHADHHDGVEGTVELAVTGAVQAVTHDCSRGRLDRCHTGEFGEGRFGTHSTG